MENTIPPAGSPIPPPPTPPAEGLQFVAAFRFLFDQPNALLNILLAAVMQIIPIVGPIVLMGWYCEIIQRLIKRHPMPIPSSISATSAIGWGAASCLSWLFFC